MDPGASRHGAVNGESFCRCGDSVVFPTDVQSGYVRFLQDGTMAGPPELVSGNRSGPGRPLFR